MKKEFFSVKKIAILGMLLALNVVLAKFSIHTLTVKVGFAFIALVISAMMYGPVEAGIVGALGDVLGFWLNQKKLCLKVCQYSRKKQRLKKKR